MVCIDIREVVKSVDHLIEDLNQRHQDLNKNLSFTFQTIEKRLGEGLFHRLTFFRWL